MCAGQRTRRVALAGAGEAANLEEVIDGLRARRPVALRHAIEICFAHRTAREGGDVATTPRQLHTHLVPEARIHRLHQRRHLWVVRLPEMSACRVHAFVSPNSSQTTPIRTQINLCTNKIYTLVKH